MAHVAGARDAVLEERVLPQLGSAAMWGGQGAGRSGTGRWAGWARRAHFPPSRLFLSFPGNFDGGYGPAGGYTQSPGGFSSPTGAQAEKKQVGPEGAGGAGGCGVGLSRAGLC